MQNSPVKRIIYHLIQYFVLSMKKFVFSTLILSLLFNINPAYASGYTADLIADGYYRQFYASPLPIVPGSHHHWVDESVCNSTDYLYTSTPGKMESFNISIPSSTLEHPITVTKIKATPCAAAYTSQKSFTNRLKVFYRYNDVDSSLYGNYNILNLNFQELATTEIPTNLLVTSNDNLEVGFKYVLGVEGVKVSRFKVELEYYYN